MTPWLPQLLLVMGGGALGAALRFYVGEALLRRFADGMPWGTLAVNLAGSFAVGFLAVWLLERGASATYARAFLIVGVLGGLTTYSSLMLECLLFLRTERSQLMLGYLATTLVLGLLLVWCGARTATFLR